MDGFKDAAAVQLPDVIKAAGSDGVDLIIIDTPPYSSIEAIKAAEQADLLLVPTRPVILDLRATVDLAKSTKRSAALVLNACPPGRGGEPSIVREARQGLKSYGLPVALVAITQLVAFSHALIDGRAVTEFEPKGKAAQEISALSNWLEEKIK
ncbi:ParA family protein [Acidobacteria bacterium AH-259-O06]|nr:ParA family protein [Acidobacteria bacterium AH-259-O06]